MEFSTVLGFPRLNRANHCVGIRKRFANPKKELNVLYTARQEELLTQH